MKKNIFQILTVLFISSLIFSSCSDDDENDDNGNNGNTSVELYVNDTKQNTKLFLETVPLVYDNGGTYGKSSFTINISFNKDDNPYLFTMMFKEISLSNINIGDDLTKISNDYFYSLSYKNDSYWLNKSDINKNDFKDYQGTVIVKEFDKVKNIMKLEFSNIKIPILKNLKPSNEKITTVRGFAKDEILIHE